MKYIVAAGFIVLLAVNALFLLKQQHVAERVATLDAQNVELTQELALRPITPEAARDAEQRLERAQVALAAIEQRLTNATAVLNNIQSSSRISSVVPIANSIPGARSVVGDIVAEPSTLTTLASPSGELAPSSSHTPDGKLQTRSWGPEQVLGAPDTHSAGDIPTAWAPLSSQGGANEWLHVNYDKPVDISEVHVRETYNPGAISKLAAVLPDGREVTIWEGTEPKAEAPVDMTFNVPQGVNAQSVKVYLDRTRVAGWNEIDAVELVGKDGTRQWASSAKASSSYAEPARIASNPLPLR